ncbi:MAG: tRNA (adenosine(37)-N6)-threonylcarbamoyltransferase complex dimerization subunit type 1 TsaB [Ferruginibacter sp.]|nr:tRNA (adenosine(37)-N6)-threonylcarbamoyltransferase complex dimerization subunit type 1 TsaB [Ferruginibacter sp.]
MSLILNIDTSTENAFVCIAENGLPISTIRNNIQKEHASFTHTAIQELFAKLKINMKQIDAVAVASGPGSYTGLRVGMATAKGICYALGKPFIAIGSLDLMATEAINNSQLSKSDNVLFCPMIDARRMEVYTALFDRNLKLIHPPGAIVLSSDFLEYLLNLNEIYFIGNGIDKFKRLNKHKNAFFIDEKNYDVSMSKRSYEEFLLSSFTDITHSEPIYVKGNQ